MNVIWRYIVFFLLLGSIALPGWAGAQEVSVPAAPHRQEHSLSCEVATLKIALGVHGINVSEKELIARLPFDPTPKGGGIWGNPNTGFVGNIDGRMLVDGYGVYARPIANLGSTYAHAEVMEHGSPQKLAAAIAQGNPVIVWGHYGARRSVAGWRTPQGEVIDPVSGEHTRLVYGFDGPVTAPTKFYLLDPSRSSFFPWSTQELMQNWSSLNYMAVVVAPPATWLRAQGETQIWEVNPQNKTRRWITSWQAFIDRGGRSAAVQTVTPAKLLQYGVAEPIY